MFAAAVYGIGSRPTAPSDTSVYTGSLVASHIQWTLLCGWGSHFAAVSKWGSWTPLGPLAKMWTHHQ